MGTIFVLASLLLAGCPKEVEVHSVAISPDQTLLAAGDHQGRIFVIDQRTGKMTVGFRMKPVAVVTGLSFTANGRYLCACSAQSILVFDLTEKTMKLEYPAVNDNFFWDCAFFPDDESVAVRTRTEVIRVALNGKITAKAKTQPWIDSDCFSSLAVAGRPPLVCFTDKKTVRVWEPRENRLEPPFEAEWILVADPLLNRIAYLDKRKVLIRAIQPSREEKSVDASTLELELLYPPRMVRPNARFSRDGNTLYIAAKNKPGEFPTKLIVWNLARNRVREIPDLGRVAAFAVSEDLVVTSGGGGGFTVWDCKTLKLKCNVDLTSFIE